MTYTCLGSNQYSFTLYVYRDQNSTNGAGNLTPFDDPGDITIFTGDGNLFSLESVQQGVETNVAINLSNPCLEPPSGIAVDQTVYNFTVTLPYNPLGYHIVYSRCCRNNSISNIASPQNQGATYTVYISDQAQTSCNNSPVFNDFPPVVICQNQPINFDHGATDVDGDSLVYSFYTPFTNSNVTGNAGMANPPPYATVSFLAPYTAQSPLGGNVAIDPNTGLIIGSPPTTGQFVVGIQVIEYRNGVEIGRIRRDFQFNVAPCATTVTADLLEDSLNASGGFVINTCNDTVITFQNQSGLADYIDGYLWEFNFNNGTIYTTTDTNPTITFPGYGNYIGMLIVNPGSTGCSDTAFVAANINRNPIANYSYTYDSCLIAPVNFDGSSSTSLDGTIEDYIWDFGDDSTLNAATISYQYQLAGTFDVQLTVIDENGCVDSTQQMVSWAPTPIIDIVPSAASGCIPLDVLFENNSYPINGYSLFWTLGDGYTSTLSDPEHTYQDTGLYTVTVRIESPLGCLGIDTFENFVNVRNAPVADFYTAYDSCELGPVSFFNSSTMGDGEITYYEWDFNNGLTAANTSYDYQYDTVGNYSVTLTIRDTNQCVEQITKEISWMPAPVIELELDQYEGCLPMTLQIDNPSYPIDGYFTLWNLGDGYYSDQASPVHTYEEEGVYDLTFTVVSPTGCFGEQLFEDLVVVNPNPVAAYSYLPEQPTNFDPVVDFQDQSTGAVAWEWYFEDGGSSMEQNPVHEFQDTGLQQVTLIITHPLGCTDTLVSFVDIKPDFTYYLPNAFTPNDDGKNDGYRGVGELFAITNFQMQIWSRWGELMFETTDPTEAWNGRKNNTGTMAANGVYVSYVTLTGPRGEKYEYKGFATVVRQPE